MKTRKNLLAERKTIFIKKKQKVTKRNVFIRKFFIENRCKSISRRVRPSFAIRKIDVDERRSNYKSPRKRCILHSKREKMSSFVRKRILPSFVVVLVSFLLVNRLDLVQQSSRNRRSLERVSFITPLFEERQTIAVDLQVTPFFHFTTVMDTIRTVSLIHTIEFCRLDDEMKNFDFIGACLAIDDFLKPNLFLSVQDSSSSVTGEFYTMFSLCRIFFTVCKVSFMKATPFLSVKKG